MTDDLQRGRQLLHHGLGMPFGRSIWALILKYQYLWVGHLLGRYHGPDQFAGLIGGRLRSSNARQSAEISNQQISAP